MLRLLAAMGAALACFTAAAHANEYSPAAKQVLAQARAASGGNGWNSLRSWHETGRQDGVPYERWVDPLRYGVRVQTREPAGLRVHGFNGAADWQILPGGGMTGVDDRLAVARARTAAFFDTHAFFFPSRFPAKGSLLGVRQNQGRAFDVLRIEPLGGSGIREVWFDRSTHLLARVVDRSGPRPVTTEFSDYRRAGAVRAPFRVTVDDGDPARRRVRQVEALAFPAADRSLFNLPPGTPWPPVARPAPPPPVAAAPPPPEPARRPSWQLWRPRAPAAPPAPAQPSLPTTAR